MKKIYHKTKSYVSRYLPEILIVIGILIFSNNFKGILHSPNYETERFLTYSLVFIGISIAIRRLMKRRS